MKDANKANTIDLKNKFEQAFINNLDTFFDIPHRDANKLITIVEDKIFLRRQKESVRPGNLDVVDEKLTDKEEKARLKSIAEEPYIILILEKYISVILCQP